MKKTILMIVVAVVIAGVSGGGVYLWQNNKAGTEKQVLSNQTTCPVCTTNQANPTGYKEFRVGSYNITATAEVPKDWSIYEVPQKVGTDKLLDSPTASIGQSDVAFGDMNWSQVDLYFVANDISANLIQAAKADNIGTWSVETISGIKADVITYPLDNGNVTKGGSGGKTYFLSFPYNPAPNFPDSHKGVITVVIKKQAMGDEEFENGVKHFFDTLKFTNQ